MECTYHLLFVPRWSDYLQHWHHLLQDVYDTSLTNKPKGEMLVYSFDKEVSKPFECKAFSQKNNGQGENSWQFLCFQKLIIRQVIWVCGTFFRKMTNVWARGSFPCAMNMIVVISGESSENFSLQPPILEKSILLSISLKYKFSNSK